MTELILFIVVGAIAVAAAVLMLLSDNAVHSALFLILTMVGIAFLFLLLNAPFLAMIQITVYAGAIMVLFIFVIMLLGAERLDAESPGENRRSFRWFTPAVLTLGMSLLFTIGLTLVQATGEGRAEPGTQPLVRFVHAASSVPMVSVRAGDATLVADNVRFGESSSYMALSAGDYEITIATETAALTLDVSLLNNDVKTIIAHDTPDRGVIATVIDDNTSIIEGEGTRVVVFNALPRALNVDLVDTGSTFVEDDTTLLLADIAPGTVSEILTDEERTIDTWAIVEAGTLGALPGQIVRDIDGLRLGRETKTLLVVTEEVRADGTASGTRINRVIPISAEARPAFGGPRAIGLMLFNGFMLPFQMLALLLLAAMVGAIVLTQREVKPITAPGPGSRRRVSRSLTSVIGTQVGGDITEREVKAPQLSASAEQPEAAGD